jgi:hypothetical protein
MLTAITIAMVANLAPPPRYDHAPRVPYHITYLPQGKLQKVCAREVRRASDMVLGCTLTELGLVYVAQGLSPEVRDLIVRHELAHINGWPHRHGAATVASLD